jgi:xylan 1,4-beta-xylosidase
MSAPLTPHAPVGAWSSLSFGTIGRGAAIQIESLDGAPNVDLVVAVQRAGQPVDALGFVEDPAAYPGWRFLSAADVKRTLTPCIDEFAAAPAAAPGITLRVFTPQPALPNPKRAGNLQYAAAPGVLLEVTIDNSASDADARAVVALRRLPNAAENAGRLRPLDWSSKTLVGIANAGLWLLAAAPVKDQIATLQSDNFADFSPRLEPAANAGGIVIQVPARSTRTVNLVFAVYRQGMVTQGLDGRFFYTNYFPRLEAVANFLLANAQRLRESCANFDSRTAAAAGDPHRLAVFSHAVRAFNARTQVLDAVTPAGPAAHFAVIAPDGPRNALERIADYLPWQLFRNPWVIRNIFDLATTAYAYNDQLRFPGDATPDELRPGGMTFARDFGFASTCAPGTSTPAAGRSSASVFDGAGRNPGWAGGQFASEILLNALYMLTGYALMADDTPWAKTRLPFARELMASLEARDHWDPAQRTGILKAESASAGAPERTAFSNLPDCPPTLADARGNLYLAVKTFCANLLLTTYYQNNNDLHSADYSYAFAQKTAAALTAAFNAQTQSLPANLLNTQDSALLLAALEPLALPTYLGLTTTLEQYFPELFAALKAHAQTCLKPAPEGCLDGTTLRLASTSPVTCPAKIVSILYVLERLFQIPAPAGVWESLAATAATNPQTITSALYIRPAAPTQQSRVEM